VPSVFYDARPGAVGFTQIVGSASVNPMLSQEVAVTSTWVKKKSSKKPLSNGPLLFHTTVLKHVVSSVDEAEFGALFGNAKEGTVAYTTLSEMVHKKDATELRTDNTPEYGTTNNTAQQKRSKAMDMILYWVNQRQSGTRSI
jgi:hypothetical protein